MDKNKLTAVGKEIKKQNAVSQQKLTKQYAFLLAPHLNCY